MQLITAFTLFSLALGVVAGPRSSLRRSPALSARKTKSSGGKVLKTNKLSTTGGTFTFDHKYEGDGFLNEWDFFSASDPTHGLVNYQTKEDAMSKGLAYVQADNTTILAVDDKTSIAPGSNRDSVRIQTQRTYNGGLFIADFAAMPHGCGVWPAYWSVGPNWPGGGEIDVLEGVHDQATNQYTLHTSEGCTLSTADTKISGKTLNQQCASSGSDNTGCAFQDTDGRSYGAGFNAVGGGVFVHQWDSTGIRAWHFARDEIPADIQSQAGNLDPSAWGEPAAFWSSGSCDMASHFYEHKLVLDTTLCGDWAGATYQSAGCPGTCGDRVANPENFADAKWQLNYIAVYQ